MSGEIDVTVRADDITDPKVIAWMTQLPAAGAEGARLQAGKRCTQARTRPSSARRCRCPTCSRPRRAGAGCRSARCSTRCRPTSRRACVTPDRKTGQPGVRHPADAARPPEAGRGRHQAPLKPPRASRPTWSACRCSPPRRTPRSRRRGGARSTLLRRSRRLPRAARRAPRRRARRAVPLIPIALATGWSGAVVFVLGLLPGRSRWTSTRCRSRSARS